MWGSCAASSHPRGTPQSIPREHAADTAPDIESACSNEDTLPALQVRAPHDARSARQVRQCPCYLNSLLYVGCGHMRRLCGYAPSTARPCTSQPMSTTTAREKHTHLAFQLTMPIALWITHPAIIHALCTSAVFCAPPCAYGLSCVERKSGHPWPSEW